MIVQSHYSRSMEDVGILESHMTRQLRTTMDVSDTFSFVVPRSQD
jgi:hypothetical protein